MHHSEGDVRLILFQHAVAGCWHFELDPSPEGAQDSRCSEE
jgi:hypothetical protein